MDEAAEQLFVEHQTWALTRVQLFCSLRRIPKRRLEEGLLEQAALLGLWNACNRYDPTRGDFRPFAHRCVMGAMGDEVRNIFRQQQRNVATVPLKREELATRKAPALPTDERVLSELHVDDVLGQLCPAGREWALCRMGGLGVMETAAEMRMSRSGLLKLSRRTTSSLIETVLRAG